jgi:hypothetical protein
MRITRVLFWFSDVCAWLLIWVLLALAFLSPIAAPIAAKMRGEVLPVIFMVGFSACCLVAVAGLYLVTRRRVAGLVLVLITCFVAAVYGIPPVAVTIATVFAASIFGGPLGLAYMEWRSKRSNNEQRA